MKDETVRWAQSKGILVVPSIDTFHYAAGSPYEKGVADIVRLRKLGVTQFQIDSVYEPAFRRK